jgi:hypothetical protein
MATAGQFPTEPPLRFELTPEQVADLEMAKRHGAVAPKGPNSLTRKPDLDAKFAIAIWTH